MKTTAEARADRVAKFGLVTPRIFGVEMLEDHGAVPYWTYWTFVIGGIRVDIHHRGDCDGHEPWEGRLELPFFPSQMHRTHEEVVVFVEAELRKLRDALVKEIPEP